MFCSKCGNQIPENSAFCENCGTPVRIPEQPADAASYQPKHEEQTEAPEYSQAPASPQEQFPDEPQQYPNQPQQQYPNQPQQYGYAPAPAPVKKPMSPKTKKIIIFSAIGAGALAIILVALFVFIIPAIKDANTTKIKLADYRTIRFENIDYDNPSAKNEVLDVGVDVVEVVDGVDYAVNHEEGLVRSGDGAGTADTYGGSGTRRTVGGHEIGACDTSLEGIIYGEHRGGLDVLHLDIGDRARKILLLNRTVTNHNHLFQHIAVLFESEVVHSLVAAYAGGNGLVAHEEHLYGVSLFDFEGIFSFGVGNGALCRVLDPDGCARKGEALAVHNLSGNANLLVLCTELMGYGA